MRHAALLKTLGIPSSLITARGLESCPEARELELVEQDESGREQRLIPAAADAWRRMKRAAADDAVAIVIVSAFRSVERQAEIIRRKIHAGLSLEAILCVSAPPGFSEHHTGRALDIGTVGAPHLDVAFEATPAFAWLQQHAAAFGFKLSYPRGNRYGYDYEPWHWCCTAPPGAPAHAPT